VYQRRYQEYEQEVTRLERSGAHVQGLPSCYLMPGEPIPAHRLADSAVLNSSPGCSSRAPCSPPFTPTATQL